MPGPHERTSSVGPSILATRPRSLRRSFVFYVRSLLHNTHRRGHSKSISKCIVRPSANQHRWTVHTRVSAHFVRSREARDRVRLHEREQAVMQGLPRITERPTTRTPHTHTGTGRGRGTRGSAGGGSTAHRRSKWRSPVLPSGHAGHQSPERNHSALRTPRPPPGTPPAVSPTLSDLT